MYRSGNKYPRSTNKTGRRYSNYKKRYSGYKRQYGKTSSASFTRAGRRLFRREVINIIEKQAETKYHEGYILFYTDGISDTSIYRDGQIVDLCRISQGSDENQRIGNQITLTSFQCKYTVNRWDFTTGDQVVVKPVFMLRCIVFTWKDDSAPTVGQVLSGLDTGTVDELFIWTLAPLNHERKVKRKILYDKTLVDYVSPNGDYTLHGNQFVDMYFPIKKFRKVYYGPTGLDGVNKLYMLLISNVDIGGGTKQEPWPVYMYFRVNYKDL